MLYWLAYDRCCSGFIYHTLMSPLIFLFSYFLDININGLVAFFSRIITEKCGLNVFT